MCRDGPRRDVIVPLIGKIIDAYVRINPWTCELKPGEWRVGFVIRYYLLAFRMHRVCTILRRRGAKA